MSETESFGVIILEWKDWINHSHIYKLMSFNYITKRVTYHFTLEN